jgi:mannose-1-phosphate guanylyltransferase
MQVQHRLGLGPWRDGDRDRAILGAAPTQPEVDYGWIEVGEELGQEQGERLYQVLQFWEKPSPAQAQVLWRQGLERLGRPTPPAV